MNPLVNFWNNLTSGDPVVFIILGVTLLAVCLSIWETMREMKAFALFFTESYEDATLFCKEKLNSLNLRYELKGYLKGRGGVTSQLKCDIYPDCLIFNARNKSMVIKDFSHLEFIPDIFNSYKLQFHREGQVLNVFLSKKEYEFLTNFINSRR